MHLSFELQKKHDTVTVSHIEKVGFAVVTVLVGFPCRQLTFREQMVFWIPRVWRFSGHKFFEETKRFSRSCDPDEVAQSEGFGAQTQPQWSEKVGFAVVTLHIGFL